MPRYDIDHIDPHMTLGDYSQPQQRSTHQESTQYPEFRIRTNATRNSSSINVEITTEATWRGTPEQFQTPAGWQHIDAALASMANRAKDDLEYKLEYLKTFDTSVPKRRKEDE